MSHHYNPNVTTEGIILYHDAANLQSYPGTGTIVRSFINNFDASLINGVTFTKDRCGAFVYNGTNQYSVILNTLQLQLTSGSVSIWAKTSSPGTGLRGIFAKQFSYGVFYDNGILAAYDWGGLATRSTGINIADGNWKHIVYNWQNNVTNGSELYLNGSLVSSFTMSISSASSDLYVGAEANANQYSNCSIASYALYNRNLNSLEVKQIFNSLKSRFGL